MNYRNAEGDRVRANTVPAVLDKIDATIEKNVRFYATQPKHIISARIAELDREWDMERWLETNASSIALGSMVLGFTVSKKWLAVSVGVLGFLFLHGVQGWCPPVPALRRAGIRTRGEIEREKYALKILRGDFQGLGADVADTRKNPADQVLNAVRA
jgi:hypothetical protein